MENNKGLFHQLNNPESLPDVTNMSLEKIEKMMYDIFENRIENAKNTRIIKYQTGRGGAIWQTIELQARIKGVKKGSKEFKAIEKRVKSKVWEDGIYSNTGPFGSLEYKGLWDDEMKDGHYLFKRHGLFYKERWVDGFRAAYEIINEEEFDKLKKDGKKL